MHGIDKAYVLRPFCNSPLPRYKSEGCNQLVHGACMVHASAGACLGGNKGNLTMHVCFRRIQVHALRAALRDICLWYGSLKYMLIC